MTRVSCSLAWGLGVAAILAGAAEGGSLTFDGADAIRRLTVSGDVKIDPSKDRGGAWDE